MIDGWNALPDSVVMAPSLNVFKSLLNKNHPYKFNKGEHSSKSAYRTEVMKTLMSRYSKSNKATDQIQSSAGSSKKSILDNQVTKLFMTGQKMGRWGQYNHHHHHHQFHLTVQHYDQTIKEVATDSRLSIAKVRY